MDISYPILKAGDCEKLKFPPGAAGGADMVVDVAPAPPPKANTLLLLLLLPDVPKAVVPPNWKPPEKTQPW